MEALERGVGLVVGRQPSKLIYTGSNPVPRSNSEAPCLESRSRCGRVSATDLENISEEIADMGKRDRREAQSRLTVLLMHLIKWTIQRETGLPREVARDCPYTLEQVLEDGWLPS